MIETTGDLINFTLRASGINGVGQTPLAEDSNTALDLLRMLLSQWQRKRWLVWNEQDTAAISTGAQWYSIGPGSGNDFAVARPDKLHSAWCRLQPFAGPNPVDLKLMIVQAPEDWARLTIKDLKSLPTIAFLDTGFPNARATFYPVPPAGIYEMHIMTKATLPVYATLTDPLGVPEEYIEALMWSLCVRLQMAYGLPSRPDHVAAMKQAINVIQTANAQVATLMMPADLMHGGSDVSNWISRGP